MSARSSGSFGDQSNSLYAWRRSTSGCRAAAKPPRKPMLLALASSGVRLFTGYTQAFGHRFRDLLEGDAFFRDRVQARGAGFAFSSARRDRGAPRRRGEPPATRSCPHRRSPRSRSSSPCRRARRRSRDRARRAPSVEDASPTERTPLLRGFEHRLLRRAARPAPKPSLRAGSSFSCASSPSF